MDLGSGARPGSLPPVAGFIFPSRPGNPLGRDLPGKLVSVDMARGS